MSIFANYFQGSMYCSCKIPYNMNTKKELYSFQEGILSFHFLSRYKSTEMGIPEKPCDVREK